MKNSNAAKCRRLTGLILIVCACLSCTSMAFGYDSYGAIAYSSSTGSWGSSYNYSSREEAEENALNRCGESDCQVRVWFVNGCGALATGRDRCYGWGWASSREEAEARALSECQSRGDDCAIRCWACTNR